MKFLVIFDYNFIFKTIYELDYFNDLEIRLFNYIILKLFMHSYIKSKY